MDPVVEPGFHLNRILIVPEILSSVLKNFSNDELNELLGVNELVDYEALRILKDRGDFIATTKESNTCEDLEDFAHSLQLMPIMPFAGMKIKLGGQHECSCQALPGHDLTVLCEEILDRINWRILEVQLLSGWNEHQDCPGFVLLKKILQMTSPVLQEFSLLVVQNQRPFLQNVLQDYTFSNLSTLKFRDVGVYTSSEEYTDFIKKLVSRAPNLQTLHTEGLVDLNANLLEGLLEESPAVHVTGYRYSPSLLGQIPANVLRSLRLKEIRLTGPLTGNGFDTITLNVLEASRTTLVGMEVDLPFFGPLMTHGISFGSVKKLKMNLVKTSDWEFLYFLIWNVAGSFGLNNLFPSLDTVHVHAECHAKYLSQEKLFNNWIVVARRGNGLAELPRAQQAEHIKNLEVNVESELTRRTANILMQMFPNVQRLSIRAKARVHFDEILRCWRHLEELDVAIEDPSNIFVIMENGPTLSLELDGIFCGIHPEEVAELREQDEDYLRNVNIVPVKASIANLKNLRTLTVFLESARSDLRITRRIWLSQVTPLIAFKKCPNLRVTIKTDDEDVDEALDHLRPYVRVVYDNLN